MAESLKMDAEDFLDEFVEVAPDGASLTLISKPDDSCILLDGSNNCRVNAVKPDQCSGFPNTWFFAGWKDDCEAILIDEKDFDREVEIRDKNSQ